MTIPSSDTPRKSVSLWLALSLALNAGLVGVVGGRLLAGASDDDDDGPHKRAIVRRFDSELPHSERREIRKHFVKNWRQSHGDRQAIEEARKAVMDAARTEPVDAKKLEAAFADLRQAENKLRARMHTTLADYLVNASPEHRELIIREYGHGEMRIKKHRRPPPHPRPEDGPPPREGPPSEE